MTRRYTPGSARITRAERQEQQGQDEHLYEALQRLRTENARRKEEHES